MHAVQSAGLTDVGQKRKENQDALFLDDRLGLYAVSDGMGGHRAGEVASRLVVAAVRDAICRPAGPPHEADPDASLSAEGNRLRFAVLAANRSVFKAAGENSAYRGMGATVSALLLTPERIVAANVGDSPIYLVHRGRIELLSVPHTLVAEHAARQRGGGPPLEAVHLRHVLTRAVGTRRTVEPALCELPLVSGDILIIGSDGLSNLVEAEEIRAAVEEHPPQEACRHLVALANQRGGDDNITVLVVKTAPKDTRMRKWIQHIKKVVLGTPSPH